MLRSVIFRLCVCVIAARLVGPASGGETLATRLPENVTARFGDSRWQAEGVAEFLQYTPDSAELIAVGGREIIVWNAQSGLVLRRAALDPAFRESPVFNADGLPINPLARFTDVAVVGKVAAVCTANGVLGVWNLSTLALNFPIAKPLGAVVGLRLSRDGTSVFVQRADHSIQEFSTADGKPVREFLGTGIELKKVVGEQRRLPICMSAKSDRLLTAALADGGGGEVIRQFDLKTARLITPAALPVGKASAIWFSDDGRLAALAEPTGDLIIWDLVAEKQQTRLVAAAPAGCAARFSPDNGLLAIRNRQQAIAVWNLSSGKQTHPLEPVQLGSSNLVTGPTTVNVEKLPGAGFAFSVDSKQLAAGRGVRSLAIWNVESGRQISLSDAHLGAVGYVLLTADGKFLITHCTDGRIRWWDLASGKLARSWQLPVDVTQVVATPDGQILVTCDQQGTLKRWQGAEGKLFATWKLPVRQNGQLKPESQHYHLAITTVKSCWFRSMIARCRLVGFPCKMSWRSAKSPSSTRVHDSTIARVMDCRATAFTTIDPPFFHRMEA